MTLRLAIRTLLGLVLGFGLYWIVEQALLHSGNAGLERLGVWLSPISIVGWLLLAACAALCIALLGYHPRLRART
jgi:ABC-type antimicrobial peptide transport system permease subunit